MRKIDIKSDNRLRMYFTITRAILLAGIALNILSCVTGIEESPAPGVLRVTLQSDPSDTTMTIVSGYDVAVSGRDTLKIVIYQGKVYSGDNYSILFTDSTQYREKDVEYNLLAREDGAYSSYVIFDSFVPPGSYSKLEFGAAPALIALLAEVGYYFYVEFDVSENLLIEFVRDFEVYEGLVTEIVIMMQPLQSVTRYRDSFIFSDTFRIVDINNQ